MEINFMIKEQVAQVLSDLDSKKLNGQFISLTTRTQSGFSASAKKAGYWKYSIFQTHNWTKDFKTLVETSTGMSDNNINYPELDESKYKAIDVNGLFCQLRSNIEAWYIRLMFNERTAKPTLVIFVGSNGKLVSPEECLTVSALKNYRGEYVPQTVKGALSLIHKVKFRNFKLENIIRLAIGGQEFIDPNLNDLISMIESHRK